MDAVSRRRWHEVTGTFSHLMGGCGGGPELVFQEGSTSYYRHSKNEGFDLFLSSENDDCFALERPFP
jgi:hypothetical protein